MGVQRGFFGNIKIFHLGAQWKLISDHREQSFGAQRELIWEHKEHCNFCCSSPLQLLLQFAAAVAAAVQRCSCCCSSPLQFAAAVAAAVVFLVFCHSL